MDVTEVNYPPVKWGIDSINTMFIMADLELEEMIWEEQEDTPKLLNRKVGPNCSFKQSAGNVKVNNQCIPVEALKKLDCDFKEGVSDHAGLLGKISDELVLKIFSYLPIRAVVKCLFVCKRWRKIGYDSSLWKKIDLDGKCFNEEGSLGRVLHRGVEVARLSNAEVHGKLCSGCCDECKRKRSKADRHNGGCFKVRYLDASMSRFSDGLLLSLLLKCRRLVKLSLEGISVGERELRAIGNNKSLQVLNLALCRGLTTRGVQAVALKCSKLRNLNLSWTGISKETLEKVCHCVKLQKLNLSGLKEAVDNKGFERLLDSCKFLTHLDVSDCTGITNASLRLICNECCYLRKLALSRCFSIDPSHLSLITKLRHLTHLDIFGFNHAESLVRLQKANPELRINEQIFSSIARPLPSTLYEGVSNCCLLATNGSLKTCAFLRFNGQYGVFKIIALCVSIQFGTCNLVRLLSLTNDVNMRALTHQDDFCELCLFSVPDDS